MTRKKEPASKSGEEPDEAPEFHPEFLQWLAANRAGFLIDEDEPLRAIDWNEELPQDFWSREWISAIEDANKRQDCSALVSLVIYGALVPEQALQFIFQFFERVERKLTPHGKRRHGRDPIPLYERVTESTRSLADAKLRARLAAGMPEDLAVTEVAAEFHMSEETLRDIKAGKHGAHERAKRRRRGNDTEGAVRATPKKRRGP
jgi:hypothetical protein